MLEYFQFDLSDRQQPTTVDQPIPETSSIWVVVTTRDIADYCIEIPNTKECLDQLLTILKIERVELNWDDHSASLKPVKRLAVTQEHITDT